MKITRSEPINRPNHIERVIAVKNDRLRLNINDHKLLSSFDEVNSILVNNFGAQHIHLVKDWVSSISDNKLAIFILAANSDCLVISPIGDNEMEVTSGVFNTVDNSIFTHTIEHKLITKEEVDIIVDKIKNTMETVGLSIKIPDVDSVILPV